MLEKAAAVSQCHQVANRKKTAEPPGQAALIQPRRRLRRPLPVGSGSGVGAALISLG